MSIAAIDPDCLIVTIHASAATTSTTSAVNAAGSISRRALCVGSPLPENHPLQAGQTPWGLTGRISPPAVSTSVRDFMRGTHHGRGPPPAPAPPHPPPLQPPPCNARRHLP